MDYFSILDLKNEPFSNSPSPEQFFPSRQHVACLQKLEIAFRLRRGLNVVIGDVGTGKSTLCRQLIRELALKDAFETHLILDPDFSSPSEFLSILAEMLTGIHPAVDINDWQLKDQIKTYLFHKGVDEQKLVILIIDEGQKIPSYCLEILRELLNFETNEYKLLQIAIFAQKEFEETIRKAENFADRINLYSILKPLSFSDTMAMVKFRLRKASKSGGKILFSLPAFWVIFHSTGGYPRKIVNLCHKSLLAMIIQNRQKVGWALLRSCAKRSAPRQTRALTLGRSMALSFIMIALLMVVVWHDQLWGLLSERNMQDNLITEVIDLPERQENKDINENLKTVKIISHKQQIKPLSTKVEFEALTEPEIHSPHLASAILNVKAVSGEKIPHLLGQVALKKKETLGWMINRIYGKFNSLNLSLVEKANPHISDSDIIDDETTILFPPITAKTRRFPQYLWIEIANTGSLSKAFQVLRSSSSRTEPIRIIPYYNNREGLRFSVIFETFFKDQDSARDKLETLSSILIKTSLIRSGWDRDTIFFSNPCLVKTNKKLVIARK